MPVEDVAWGHQLTIVNQCVKNTGNLMNLIVIPVICLISVSLMAGPIPLIDTASPSATPTSSRDQTARDAAEASAAVSSASPSADETTATVQRPYELVLDWFSNERDRFSADLEAAQELLLVRARGESPDFAIRLEKQPSAPRPHGYGILPELRASADERTIELQKTDYALKSITTEYVACWRDAAVLRQHAATDTTAALAPMVDEYERLVAKLRNLESNLEYHTSWQASVIEYAEWFAKKNRLSAKVAKLKALLDEGASTEQTDPLRHEILADLAPFRPTEELSIEARGDRLQYLPVRVVTDISDTTFIAAFRGAVLETYNESEAARSSGFVLELQVEQIPIDELYPQGAPEKGARLDDDDHLGRFPADALVLTTGASRTVALVGRSIQLGPEPRSHRSLAHEFGHLLGFGDAYLRAYQGSPDDPFGVVLIEWTGLQDDLMGSPGHGRVSEEMIGRLIEGYADP